MPIVHWVEDPVCLFWKLTVLSPEYFGLGWLSFIVSPGTSKSVSPPSKPQACQGNLLTWSLFPSELISTHCYTQTTAMCIFGILDHLHIAGLLQNLYAFLKPQFESLAFISLILFKTQEFATGWIVFTVGTSRDWSVSYVLPLVWCRQLQHKNVSQSFSEDWFKNPNIFGTKFAVLWNHELFTLDYDCLCSIKHWCEFQEEKRNTIYIQRQFTELLGWITNIFSQ